MSYPYMIMVLMISSLSVMMQVMTNPLGLGLIMLGLAALMTVVLAAYLFSWFAYILFLIYIGGLMVLVIYMSMLSSNFLFNLSWLSFGVMGTVTLLTSYVIYFYVSSVVPGLGYWNNLSYLGQSFPSYLVVLLGGLLYIIFLGMVQIVFSGKNKIKLSVH